MGDLFLGLLLVLVIVFVVGMVQFAIHRDEPRKHPDAKWKVDEHPREINHEGPRAYAFYCVHPDEEPQLVDAVYWNDPDFDIKVDELRVEAELRCDTLNRKRLKR